MKNILKLITVSAGLLLNGCGGDNAYDGSGVIGGNSSGEQSNALSSLQKNVFSAHSGALLQSVNTLSIQVDALSGTISTTDVQALREKFKSIIHEWKSVEATYIAGDYDSSLIDNPQFIDFYHTGKKLNIPADIDNALNQGGDIGSALFKNSSKSINALEYLIFGYYESSEDIASKMNISNKRRVDAMKVVLTNLQSKISPIATFYQSNGAFSADETEGSNAIVNALIASSFKLKEWRVGEAAGISIKFRDDPSPTRLEYYNSRLSLDGIKTILKTHQDVMGTRGYENFGTFASANGAQSVVISINNQINDALAIANSFPEPLENIIGTSGLDPRVENLYNSIRVLQSLYFESLIQALNLTAEIIEADGD